MPPLVIDDGKVIGTLTVTLDGPAGLLADLAYRSYVDDWRGTGHRCAEITKLAFDSRGKRLSAIEAGFQSAVQPLVAHGITDLFVEVNPSSVKLYRDRMKFWPVGDQTITERVGAPARLLWIELRKLQKTIHRSDQRRIARPGPGDRRA